MTSERERARGPRLEQHDDEPHDSQRQRPAQLAAGGRARRQRRHRVDRRPRRRRRRCDQRPRPAILIAGIAGLVAGALSMAAGEYVSVSTQRDSEKALLDKERRSSPTTPEERAGRARRPLHGQGPDRSEPRRQVAAELTAHDALAAHAEVELGIDPDDLTNPWHAAVASMVAFTVGALLPLLTITLAPASARLWVTASRSPLPSP